MTTLPQTTPIRLPRVAGSSSQLAVPGGQAATVAAAPAGIQMTPGDVWRVIRANLWLIVLLAVVSAVGGFFLNDYLAKHYARYSTYGLIRIRGQQSTNPLQPASEISAEALERAQRTQTVGIKADSTLDDVLMESDNPIRQTAWWRVLCNGDPQIAHQKLSEQLSVDPEPGSELIRVAVTGPIRADTPVLITSIVNRAIQNQRQDNRSKVEAERKMLADAKDRNDAQLRSVSRELRDRADELNRDGGTTDGHSSKDIELSREVDRNIQLQNDKVTAENAYNGLKSQIDRGEIPAKVSTMVEADRDVQEYKATERAIQDQLAYISGDGNQQHPNILAMQKRLAQTQQSLQNVRSEKTAQFSRMLLDDLSGTRQTSAQLLEQSNAQVATLKQAIADLATKYGAYVELKDREATYRDKGKQYDDRMNNLENMIREADFGSLAWYVRPLEPVSPSFPKLTNVMAGCVGAGLMLALGIAFLRELTDTTVRSPRDIARMGQMAFLGMVSHETDDPQSSGARLPLVIFEAPQSIMAEQLRQVRTRLQHAASLDTTRSILVTSAGPGDGKSTMAVNLAAGLALNGRRILLIDANFRRPELHRIFGIGNEVGFSDVLNDINAFASAVRETTVPNLSVMPSGAKPGNSTELLESQLLLDAIERALEEYDHVIFDSGPMLFVSESVALAPRVDGVVTVVRARSSSRGVLTRMRDSLRAVKAEHLGVILNGVRSQAGGYYGRSIKTYYEYQNQA